jgi:hypothetical protein
MDTGHTVQQRPCCFYLYKEIMIPLKTYLLTRRLHFLHAFILTAVLFLNSACVPMMELNDEFEYNPSKKRELGELKKTYDLLSRMEEIDVALHLSKRDFLSLVNDSFTDFSRHFTSLGAGDFSNVRFGPMRFHLSNQQLVSQIEFSLQVDGLQREIYGHVMATHRLEAASNRFVLKTDFDEIIVRRIDGSKVVDKSSENLKLIEKAAKNFMHTLNVEIIDTPLSIPVDLNILSGVNGKDIFFASDYKLHSAKSVNMLTKMQMYLPYICKSGVVFLGSTKIRHTAGPLEEEMDIKGMSNNLKNKIDAGLQKSMGVSLSSLQEGSSYYVSKAYLSEQMNFSLKEMDLRMINKFFLNRPEDEHNLTQKIYFSGKEYLPSCQGVIRDCAKTQLQCNRNCSKSYGIERCTSCEKINNPFEKVRCMSGLEACKSRQELHLYECLKEEQKCTLNNTKRDDQCRKDNIARITQCEAKKQRFLFTNDTVELGTLHLTFSISNSYAIQRIHRIRFDADLSGIDVQRNLHISVDSGVNLDFEDAGLEDINCSLIKEEPLFVHSSADRMNILSRVPVVAEYLSDGTLMIKAENKEKAMPIKLRNSPYDRLLGAEAFLLSCNYQDMPLMQRTAKQLVLNGDMSDLMAGKLTLRFEDEEFSFRVSPVKIGTDLLFYPRLQKKAIVFAP